MKQIILEGESPTLENLFRTSNRYMIKIASNSFVNSVALYLHLTSTKTPKDFAGTRA